MSYLWNGVVRPQWYCSNKLKRTAYKKTRKTNTHNSLCSVHKDAASKIVGVAENGRETWNEPDDLFTVHGDR